MEPKDSDSPHRGLELGKFTAQGATSLFFSKIAQQMVSIVGSIILIRLLVSPGVYAYIGVATTLPGLVMLGNFTGVNAALTKYLSAYRIEKNSNAIWSSFWSALSIKLLTGVALAAVAYFAADPIGALIGKQSVDIFLLIASPLPIVWTLQISVKSTLLSLGRAKIFSVYQIIDEILLSSLPIAAVVLGYGVVGALVAMVIANFVSLGIALSMAISTVFAETRKGERKMEFAPTARKLVKFGIPQGISNSYGTFAVQIINLIIARFVSLDVYGWYTVAVSASGLANYVSDPVSAMIYPAFSQVKGSQNHELLRSVYTQAIRYSTLIYLPLGLFFVIFAQPFLVLFFGSPYAGAGIILTILSAMQLTYGLGSSTTGTLLTSQGYSTFSGTMSMLGITLGMIIALVALPTIGFLPYLIFAGLAFVPSFALNLQKVRTLFHLAPPFKAIRVQYLAILLSSVVTVPLAFIALPIVAELALGALLICSSYIFFAIVLRAVDLSDTLYLKTMLSTQTIVTRVTSPFFKLIDVLIKSIGAGT